MLVCVALRLGMWSEGSLSLSGEQLDNLAPHETGDTILQVSELPVLIRCQSVTMCVAVPQTSVFYRVTPKHKVIIVKVSAQPTHNETKY